MKPGTPRTLRKNGERICTGSSCRSYGTMDMYSVCRSSSGMQLAQFLIRIDSHSRSLYLELQISARSAQLDIGKHLFATHNEAIRGSTRVHAACRGYT